MQLFDEKYWTDRYENEETGWDIGYISTPIKDYVDQLQNKSLNILIPGCGNAYEALYLHQKGFRQTYLLDISKAPLQKIALNHPEIPEENLIYEDFFMHKGHYDLILEQTFFCAIDPKLRNAYVQKMLELLKPGGQLVGLLFNDELFVDHPPFGGYKADYLPLFENHFDIHILETAYNSIKQRAQRELFIKFVKPR